MALTGIGNNICSWAKCLHTNVQATRGIGPVYSFGVNKIISPLADKVVSVCKKVNPKYAVFGSAGLIAAGFIIRAVYRAYYPDNKRTSITIQPPNPGFWKGVKAYLFPPKTDVEK